MKNACRISRVKMKNGGACVHILRGNAPHKMDDIFNNAKALAREYGGKACGYFILAHDGRTVFQWHSDDDVYKGNILGSVDLLTDSIRKDF